MYYDIPTYRGLSGGSYTYWTSADAVPGGVTDTTLMKIQGISGSMNPFSIPDMIMWYRSDFGVTRDGDGRVSEWKDLSGNRFHVVQSTAANRPFYNISSSLFNGKPALDFDYAIGTFLTCSHNTRQQPGNMTIFAVFQMATDYAGYSTIIGKTDSGAWSNGWALGSIGGTTDCSFWYNGYGNYSGKGDYTKPTKILASGRRGTTILYRSNGYSQATAAPGAIAASTNVLQIGTLESGYHFSGSLAEIIVYKRALPDSDMYNVEMYLSQKYGIGTQ